VVTVTFLAGQCSSKISQEARAFWILTNRDVQFKSVPGWARNSPRSCDDNAIRLFSSREISHFALQVVLGSCYMVSFWKMQWCLSGIRFDRRVDADYRSALFCSQSVHAEFVVVCRNQIVCNPPRYAAFYTQAASEQGFAMDSEQ
jgi:hypothetical protein